MDELNIVKKYFNFINQGVFDIVDDYNDVWTFAFNFLTEREKNELVDCLNKLLNTYSNDVQLFNLINDISSEIYVVNPEDIRPLLRQIIESRAQL
jgi:hypothetical protein